MNLYESVKENLKEYSVDQYNDRHYSKDEAISYLEKVCKELNSRFTDNGFNFDWRIEGRNLKIFDRNEAFSYEAIEYEDVERIVKKIFGDSSYLEPENTVIMTIAGAYLKETEELKEDEVNPYDYHVSEYPQEDGTTVYQINKSRPYDDADYHWARSEDSLVYQIYFKGRPVGDTIYGAEDTIEKLKELNKEIEPRMMHN